MTSVWNIESLEVNPGNPTGVILPKDLPGNTVVDLVAKPIIISPNWVWFTLTYGWNLLDMIGFNHIHWKPSILLLTSFPDFPWFMCPEGLNDFLPHASGTQVWMVVDNTYEHFTYEEVGSSSEDILFRTIKTTSFLCRKGTLPTVASVVTTWWTFSPSAKPSAWWAGE